MENKEAVITGTTSELEDALIAQARQEGTKKVVDWIEANKYILIKAPLKFLSMWKVQLKEWGLDRDAVFCPRCGIYHKIGSALCSTDSEG